MRARWLPGFVGILLVAHAAVAAPPHWAQWRGPDGQGIARDPGVLLEWSATKNVLWKTAIPGTPDDLLDAVRRGHLAGVRAALDAGVPADTPFRYERTALSFAADRGHLEIAGLLLDRGADPNKKDTFYSATAMTWAVGKGHVAIVRLLIERGALAGPELLQSGAREGNAELVTLALEKAKPSADDLSVALAEAQGAKHDAVVEQLTKAGAKPRNRPTSWSTRRRSPATPASTATRAATSCASRSARESSSARTAARRAWCWARRTR